MIERTFDAIGRAVLDLKYRYVRARLRTRQIDGAGPAAQDLAIYSDPVFDESSFDWAEGTAWTEIQHLLATARGRVLDIACGAGPSMLRLRGLPRCVVYGCDLSRLLLTRAVERGVGPNRLARADATRLPYVDDAFEYSYSIGSLEHFTENGIAALLAESRRVTRRCSFHQIPTSRSGRDEGWLKFGQSYFNNSVDWWLLRFRAEFPTVTVFESRWEDAISRGRWFVCERNA